MSEQKKKVGRPSKYGTPEAAKRIKAKKETLTTLIRKRQVEYSLMDFSPEQKKAAQALTLAHEALITSVTLKDLVDKYSEIDLPALVAKHPPIAYALWMRFNSFDDLASVGHDASIRAMIEKVIHDGKLNKVAKDNADKKEERKEQVKAIAAKLLKLNNNKKPPAFIIKIQSAYRDQHGRNLDEKTIRSYLK
jgi:hypothetical protein